MMAHCFYQYIQVYLYFIFVASISCINKIIKTGFHCYTIQKMSEDTWGHLFLSQGEECQELQKLRVEGEQATM